ncbi:MAG TPA: hypothetical protein VFR94_17885 [Nitrososphaeraceae archaeon]|nr:hypothetical protein [Nitrososphaeraceae archaeon]
MYKAFLSHAQLKEYLSFLLKRALLRKSLSKLGPMEMKNW